MIRSYRLYGLLGHRQRMTFNPSTNLDFTNGPYARPVRLHIANADETGTNDYSVMTITAPDQATIDHELWAQIDDGMFENCRVGRVLDEDDHEVLPPWSLPEKTRPVFLVPGARYCFDVHDDWSVYVFVSGDEIKGTFTEFRHYPDDGHEEEIGDITLDAYQISRLHRFEEAPDAD